MVLTRGMIFVCVSVDFTLLVHGQIVEFELIELMFVISCDDLICIRSRVEVIFHLAGIDFYSD